ncbi:MAG: hypothetical protein KGI33_09955 [Thaumarchaeota archaeon]|nr:hypothetical protein [Nitrososphaerota archaeon]
MKNDNKEPVHLKKQRGNDAVSREEDMMRRAASESRSRDAISEEEKIRRLNSGRSKDAMSEEE